jgi:hypothetical protein
MTMIVAYLVQIFVCGTFDVESANGYVIPGIVRGQRAAQREILTMPHCQYRS